MRILAVGGGSGGHVTPVAAVIRELKAKQPDAEIHFWCDKKFAVQAQSIMHRLDDSIQVTTIHAGKLRRYHTLTMWQHLLHPLSIVFPNIRDLLLVMIGFIESFFRLIMWRPDVVFTKGGFVCLPVGMAARLLKIPIVIHDSDPHPGLTNRLLAGGATSIATGAPLHNYPYPKSKSHYVGIPIAADFRPFTEDERKAGKEKLGFDPSKPLIVVTGGGLGAKRLNNAVTAARNELTKVASVLLLSGAGQYDSIRSEGVEDTDYFKLKAFVSEGMVNVLGAADIVIARAGATTIMELAALAKPTILVPNAYLTGGHQLKNAAAFAEDDAVAVLDEDNLEKEPLILVETIKSLLNDDKQMRHMQQSFFTHAKPRAADDVASLILQAAKEA